MVKFRWTKYLYYTAIGIFLLTSFLVPYVRAEDVTKKIFFIYPMLQLVVQLIFARKFEGDLEMTPIQTFVIYTVVSHFIPFGYYFMLRRAYTPVILYIALIVFSIVLQAASLYFWETMYKIEWRKCDND